MLILRLELKRMLKGRLTRVLLPLALLLSLLMAYLPVTFCYTSYTDPAGNEVQLTGLASAAGRGLRLSHSGAGTAGRGNLPGLPARIWRDGILRSA